jgi:hypothetical protein
MAKILPQIVGYNQEMISENIITLKSKKISLTEGFAHIFQT